jgi:hypothetical protein
MNNVHMPARKGDLVAYETQSSIAYVNGPTTHKSTYQLARVVSVTREGFVRLVDDGYGKPKQFDRLRPWWRAVVTSANVDTDDAWTELDGLTWESVSDLRAALTPYRRES